MDTNMLFSIGLNLSFPWKVVKSEFRLLDESNIRELHIWIDFEYGSRFISSKGTVEDTSIDTPSRGQPANDDRDRKSVV